jgi:hypothetical protein
MTTLNIFSRLKKRFFTHSVPRRPFRRHAPLVLEALEARELLSGTPAAAVSLAHVVDNLYETVLGRAPGPNEEAIWINAMQAGLSPAATVPQFLKSPEYIANQVRDQYSHLLGRAPEPQAAAFWLQTRSARVSDPAVAGLTDDQMAAANTPAIVGHDSNRDGSPSLDRKRTPAT